jgi:hypothetical protein
VKEEPEENNYITLSVEFRKAAHSIELCYKYRFRGFAHKKDYYEVSFVL